MAGTAAKFHLAWFLNQGYGLGDWQGMWRGSHGKDWIDGEAYVEFARSLERAGFDYVIIEDSNFVSNAWGGNSELYLKLGYTVPKHDPTVLASVLAQHTSRLGVVATASVTEWPPYLLARHILSLDHVSHGRIGWNIVTGSSDLAAKNFGKDGQPLHDKRYEIAHEYADLVHQLWDTWEPGAMVMDAEKGVYVDHTKVHTIDFQGEYFASRGPLNVMRSPQERPVIVQAGASPKGREFGARFADTIIAAATDIEEMREYRESVRAMAEGFGRKPDDVKCLFLITPHLGATDAEAQERFAAFQQDIYDDPSAWLAFQGFTTNIDFSVFDLDTPLGELAANLTTNGHQSVLDKMLRGNEGKTLREVASAQDGFVPVGSPATVADQLEAAMAEVGGDGFLLYLPQLNMFNRRTIAEITDGLVPELQRRGLVRTEYTYEHFRDNLTEF